ARERNRDRAGAKPDYVRALELSPGYIFAGLSLLDILLDDQDWDAAATTLSTLREHADGPFVTARAVRLAVARGDRSAPLERLRPLATTADDDLWPLTSAQKAIDHAGWSADAERVLSDALVTAEPPPSAGALWVDDALVRDRFAPARRIDAMASR